MRTPLWLSIAASLSIGASACTSAGSDGADAIDNRAGSLGLLQVERVAEGGDDAPMAELGAAFARYHGTDTQAVARLLGATHGTELESCSLVSDDIEGLAATDATVDLLDIGTIDVHVGESEAHLVPRTFPELARVAAGFFYAGDTDVASVPFGSEEYAFHAQGSAELPGFDVAVPAPYDPVDVRVNGTNLANDLVLARDRDLDFVWEAADPRDQMELELMSEGQTLSCLTRDDGAFRVSAADLAALSADSEARLVVRRVRVQPFDAAGVDVAYVRLASTRVFDVSVR
ncbi:MAG: hypothetical protein IPK60_13580 [Sandaracinaceae bacterium]|jgi:hypothetical protein|nr:hypothetical protein [Sandaracinaceae bacterium]